MTLQLYCYSYYSNIGEEMYEKLKCLAHFDPLLLPNILYICPSQELSSLFLLMPIYLSTKFMVYMIKRDWKPSYSLKYDRVSMYFCKI